MDISRTASIAGSIAVSSARPREVFLLVAVLHAVLPAVAFAREPDPLEAIRAGSVQVLIPLGARGPTGDTAVVRAPGRDLAPVAPDGSYRLEGLPVGRPLRLSVIGGVLERASDPVMLAAPPVVGGDVPLDLDGSSGTIPLRRGIELLGPGGSRYLLRGTTGIRSLLSPAHRSSAGALENLDPDAPGLRLRSTDPGVVSVSAAGEAVTIGPGRAWAVVEADGEDAACAVEVDLALDSDRDGLPDSYEAARGLDPANPADAALDRDGDGLTELDEFLLGTNPQNLDTDSDGLDDRAEARQRGTDPLRPDSDGDGAGDGLEVASATDPLNPNERPGTPFTPAARNSVSLTGAGVRLACGTAGGNDYVYAITADGRLTSFQIDPVAFFISFRDSLTFGGTLMDVAVEGTRAYVAAGAAGVHVVDITNPVDLRIAATLTGLGNVAGIAVEGGLLYLTSETGLRIMEPLGNDNFRTASTLAMSGAGRIALGLRLAFVGETALNRLFVVDIAHRTAPVVLQRFELPEGTPRQAALAVSGRNVFVAQGSAGVLAISAEDPAALKVSDTSVPDLPGGIVNGIAVLGNLLFAHDDRTAVRDRAQIFRFDDAGRIARTGDVRLGVTGLGVLLARQNYLMSFSTDSRIAVSQVLEKSDRAGLPPSGTLVVLGSANFVPGSIVTLEARIRDDFYVDEVEFLVDGTVLARDAVPPFRFAFTAPGSPPPPRELLVEARGRDLAGSWGPTAAALVIVEEDIDRDGIADPLDRDRDGDGLSGGEEEIPGADGFTSDPLKVDSDGDGIADGEEAAPGADGAISDPASSDGDGDALPDPVEIAETGTGPLSADSDGDGIADGDEDSDGDALSNLEELALGTRPGVADTDADGVPDGPEVRLGLDPLRSDSDGDGLGDGAEDSDGDGLTNASEIARATDPAAPDSDGDGVGDGDEVALGTDPAAATDFSAADLRLTDAVVTLHAPLKARSLDLVRSTVRPLAAQPADPLVIELSGLLRLDAQSRLDAAGLGFPGGFGPGNSDWRGLTGGGVAAGEAGSGGSHGGRGGSRGASGVSATGHGRWDEPRMAGGGGSADPAGGRGGSGGGIIRISSGSIELNGLVDANGEGAGTPGYAGGRSGAGAGGSIWIEAGRLRGAGEIRADGGKALPAGALVPGGGGGGRIRIECDDLATFDRSRIHARGGGLSTGGLDLVATGGAGTVSFREAAKEALVIENGGLAQAEPRTELLGVGRGTIAAVTDDSITRAEGPFAGGPDDLAGLSIDPDVGDADFTTFRVLGHEGATLLTEPGLLARAQIGDVFRGAIVLDRLDVSRGGALKTDDGLQLLGPGTGPEAREFVLDGAELHAGSLRLVQARDVKLLDAVLALEEEFDAAKVSLDSALLSVSGTLRSDSLSLVASTIAMPPIRSGTFRPLAIEVVGAVSLDAQSRIDLVGRGYAGGYSAGNASPSGESAGEIAAGGPFAGGSHGGIGGHASPDPAPTGEAPAAYGDFREPMFPGGGGSTTDGSGVAGGDGGGILRLEAAELSIDGAIDASGVGADRPELFSTDRAGGGAGGGVLIEVGILRGGGSVRANGGAALRGAFTSGGGGGGRIAVRATDLQGFTGFFEARGGGLLPTLDRPESQGGAGTVFVLRPAAQTGELRIDNGGEPSSPASTPITAVDTPELRFARLVVRGAARAAADRPLIVEAADPEDAARFTIAGSLGAPRLDLPAVATLDLSLGTLDADLRLGGPLGLLRMTDAVFIAYQPLVADEIDLTRSTIAVPDSSRTKTFPLVLTVEETLRIDAGSRLDALGKGYPGGLRGGNTSHRGQTVNHTINVSTSERTGGSHGALGGYFGTGQLGTGAQPVYDSYLDPQYPGSGGSGTQAGAAGFNGGGVIRITAREVSLDGLIDARGEGAKPGDAPSLGGGGAGGAVLLDVETLAGTGEIAADGGAASFDGGTGTGTGGGGRVAVYFTSMGGFLAARIHVYGGALVPANPPSSGSFGGAGTVFLKGDAQGYGDLIIDNGGRVQSIFRTTLRAVGAGTIATLTANTLRGDKTFPFTDTKVIGQWVVVKGATAVPFRILDNTSTVLTTDPTSGNMTAIGAVGDSYQGAIILDNLTVRGAGFFSTLRRNFGYDLVIIATGTVSVTGLGQLDAPPVVHW